MKVCFDTSVLVPALAITLTIGMPKEPKGGGELPGICSCLLEGKAARRFFVSSAMRCARARIDENALHRTHSCRFA